MDREDDGPIPSPRVRWARAALIIGAALLGWALVVWLSGGFRVSLAGARISSTDSFRPAVLGGVLTAIGLAYTDAPLVRALLAPGSRVLPGLALGLSALTFVLGATYGTFVAGGPDPYGYVSQAALWRGGTLIADAPLSDLAPWAVRAFTPVGYVPATAPGAMVPQYPPGLSMVMAVFQMVGGEAGAYFVVPVLGALAVWLTYLLGVAMSGPVAGVMAASLLVASPVFLKQLMFPMSDVPAAAWWLLAVVLALNRGGASLVCSGLAAALAVLTRPNLAVFGPMTFVLALHGSRAWGERGRRALLWGVPALAGPLVLALIQDHLYGSPFATGYGSAANYYSLAYFAPNVERYFRWLMSAQTPLVLLGAFLLPFARRRPLQSRWLVVWALVFAAVGAMSYLWYIPFDDRDFLRFFLPVFPMLLTTAAVTLALMAGTRPLSRAVAGVLFTVVVCHGLGQAEPAFAIGADQARYRTSAEAARALPPNAVVISNLHSGSVRYYANRLTLRFEWLPPEDYQRALRLLREHRHPVYAMLEDVEVAPFKARYAAVADLSWLNRPPLQTFADRVRLYALD